MSRSEQSLSIEERTQRFAEENARARAAMMREDGQRSLGENLEQLDLHIRALFELASAMESSRR